ncbi:MAG: hemolysin III family protein [Candidatus Dormibacteraeota bacterium]|nr:hemolysin III family protein [Candidatus Dormibacteraeota bacterium]
MTAGSSLGDSLGDTVDAGADAARAAVAFVKPRLRGVMHEVAFPISLLGGAWAILHTAAGAPRVATAIYAATLSACLGVSALYHRRRWSLRAHAMMRRLDHATIFMLVAGTFTPIAAIAVSGGLRIVTLAVVWGGAVLGTVLNAVRVNLPRAIEVGPYLAIGAFGVVLLPHLLGNVGVAAVTLLLAGAALYVAGALVFAWQRPNPWPRTFGFHELFHSAVLTAALLQWIAITYWVLPAA